MPSLSAAHELPFACDAFLRAAAGPKPFVRNVRTRFGIVEFDGQRLPLTIDDGGDPSLSYVVSPLNGYTGYALAELHKLGLRPLERVLGWIIGGAQSYLARNRLDRVVHVNNWLLATNLWPRACDGRTAASTIAALCADHPDHALVFRSLNPISNADLLANLVAAGCALVPSRQVYLFDCSAGIAAPHRRRTDVKRDARLLARSAYRRVAPAELGAGDFPRLEQLYRALYIDKYCHLNPQFSADWLAAGHRDGWLELHALRGPTGRIDGVLGLNACDGVLTSPVVGYDTALPQSLGLYRMLSAIALEIACERRALLNFSAGVGGFKRSRGGRPVIEYSAVYSRHLPPARQRAWGLIGALSRRIGVPLLRAFRL